MNNGHVLWKIGEKIPQQLQGVLSSKKWLQSMILPRPVAWLTVDDEHVTILDGYTAACYTPPTLLFAESSLPKVIATKLHETGKCTLSVATRHDPITAIQQMSDCSYEDSMVFTLKTLNLSQAPKWSDYPCAIVSSPIHMYCTLSKRVNFDGSNDCMIVLVAERVVVHESVISDATENMKQRSISGKIDAALIQPIVSIGQNQFRTMKEIRSMPRPKLDDNSEWKSSDFQTVIPTGTRTEHHQEMIWNYQTDGHTCHLGFNPTLAFIMPRPIGWISTYSKIDRVPHLAPYSFFIDVSHDGAPMVAFSAYRPMEGKSKKDAHKDAEETGCFCFNLCTEDFAVEVNYSAAELTRDESEFVLAGLTPQQSSTVDAPYIRNIPIYLECVYEKTIDIGSFSIVIGKVQAVAVDTTLLNDEGHVDVTKLKLIGRLGYNDEYGIIS